MGFTLFQGDVIELRPPGFSNRFGAYPTTQGWCTTRPRTLTRTKSEFVDEGAGQRWKILLPLTCSLPRKPVVSMKWGLGLGIGMRATTKHTIHLAMFVSSPIAHSLQELPLASLLIAVRTIWYVIGREQDYQGSLRGDRDYWHK